MADSDITVSGLTASPGIGDVTLQWQFDDPHTPGGLPQLQLAAVEVWASATNDRAAATKIAQGRDNALHTALIEGATWYYWIKARNNSGLFGDWYPSGATSGVTTTVLFSAATYVTGAVYPLINGKFVASTSSGALTVAIKTLAGADPSSADPVLCSFRDTSSALLGVPVFRQITAATSITLPAGGRMGDQGINTPLILYLVGVDNGGTVVLGVTNCNDGLQQIFPIDESALYDTVAISSAADDAGVIYTPSAVTGKAIRIFGRMNWEAGLAVAGVWTDPTTSTLFGPGMKKPGEVVQVRNLYSQGVSSDNATIPFDGTTPQSSEGWDPMSGQTVTIQPRSAGNILEHQVFVPCTHATANVKAAVALFRGAAASAFVVGVDGAETAGYPINLQANYRELALATTSLSFSVRVGANTAVGSLVANGSGVPISLVKGYKITEVQG